jgi:hypothetical protein
MEYLGLLFELLFFALGAYVYALTRGLLHVNDAVKPFYDNFMKENKTMLRILSLLVIAIMGLNIILHIAYLFKK